MTLSSEQLELLKFPIGQFSFPKSNRPAKQWIETIQTLPDNLEKELEGLNDDQLNWPYRPDGWTILQVVHHLVDSHLNAFKRVKRTLTEENPTIFPYNQDLCVQTADASLDFLSDSLMILKGLHKKWSALLFGLEQEQWARTFHHTEWNRNFSLVEVTALYDWHCKTHLAHIRQAIESKGKYSH